SAPAPVPASFALSLGLPSSSCSASKEQPLASTAATVSGQRSATRSSRDRVLAGGARGARVRPTRDARGCWFKADTTKLSVPVRRRIGALDARVAQKL